MKQAFLSGLAIVLAMLAILFVYPGRGGEPSYPLLHHDQSESDPYTNVPATGCRRDIDVYVSLIDEVHADPFFSVSEDAFKSKAEELKDRLASMARDSIQLIECYFYMKELAAVIQDEHTDIPIMSGWWNALPSVFPVQVKIVDNRFYAKTDLGGSGIPRYAELVRINGVPLSEVLAKVMPFQNNTLDHFKLEAVEEDFHFWLQGYFRMKPPWTVDYRRGGELESVSVDGIDRDEYRERTRRDDGYSAFTLDAAGVAVPVLDIPRFWYPDRSAYEAFMDSFFVAHAADPYLVIDLRRNPGGDGRWGFYVLDYLTDSEYETLKRFSHRVSEPYKAITRYYIEDQYYRRHIPRVLRFLALYGWLNDYDWKEEAGQILAAQPGAYLEFGVDVWERDANKMTFGGKTYLLTSHQTNSAAVVFAAIFKHNGLGTIVGQETGGRESFMSDPIFIELPNTMLRAKIPVAILELPGDNPGRGVLPDVEVEYSIEDYVAGHDRHLEAVRDLIRDRESS